MGEEVDKKVRLDIFSQNPTHQSLFCLCPLGWRAGLWIKCKYVTIKPSEQMKLWLKEKRRVNPEELLQWKNSAVSAFWRSLRCRNRAVTKVLQAQTLNIIKPLTTTVLEKGLRNLYLKVSQYLQKRKNGLKKFENKESYVAIQKDLKYQSILAMMLV